MAQAKIKDTVFVHYTGSFTDGTVFDSSTDRDPLEFTIGQSMVIPGFENGVVGMSEGESRVINIPAEEGYGLHREDLLAVVERSQIPTGLNLEVGRTLQARSPEGGVTNVVIRAMSDENVTLDFNHPLAGKDLVFKVQLVKINPV